MSSYPTPFTPPTTEDDRLSWLRLIRSRKVGVATFYRLLAEQGSADAALAHLPELAASAGIPDYAPFPDGAAAAEMAAGRRAGARLVARGEPDYPRLLAEAADAPPLLWVRGDTLLGRRPAVAVVGARNASALGMRMARKLAAELSEAGLVVVSGLARGIDATAHLAALDGGTIAAVAGGVDTGFPQENRALARDIGQRGLILSEQPPGLEPLARHFPMRNRLIAGLCHATVVVEAAAQSGSLLTARLALDLGRDVMAVPGHPFDGRAWGCNALIRDGATLVRGADDVLSALPAAVAAELAARPRPGPAAPAPDSGKPASQPMVAAAPAARDWRDQAALHRAILDRLGPSPLAEDQLLRDLHLAPAAAAPELLTLELEGRIHRAPGGLLSRV